MRDSDIVYKVCFLCLCVSVKKYMLHLRDLLFKNSRVKSFYIPQIWREKNQNRHKPALSSRNHARKRKLGKLTEIKGANCEKSQRLPAFAVFLMRAVTRRWRGSEQHPGEKWRTLPPAIHRPRLCIPWPLPTGLSRQRRRLSLPPEWG